MEFLIMVGVIAGLFYLCFPIIALVIIRQLKNTIKDVEAKAKERIDVLYRQVDRLNKVIIADQQQNQTQTEPDKPAPNDESKPIVQPEPTVQPPELEQVEPVMVEDDVTVTVTAMAVPPQPIAPQLPAAATIEQAAVTPETIAPETIAPTTKAAAIVKPPAPKPVAVPTEPSKIRKYLNMGWQWLKSINVFVSVGVLVLFIGMTFLIKHAIDENLLPIQYRLAGIIAVAISLLLWGWRQRLAKPVFAMTLQGGAIAIIYLTVFASYSMYQLIPSPIAFIMLGMLVVLGSLLAVKQDAIALAIMAIAGGFAAPILTSSGSNNYIGLFSFYSVLNAGIFFIAWHKAWRALNMLGFVFTFSISALWGAASYSSEFYLGTQLFLALFVLMYLCIAILFSNRQKAFYKDYVDSSLVFGTPLIGFSLQMAIVDSFEYGIAISAVCFGLVYIGAAQLLWSRFAQQMRLLCEACLVIGIGFITLAIPFAIDGAYTGAIWAIEGAGVLWLSVRQQQKNRRLLAIGLIVLSPVMLLLQSNGSTIDSNDSIIDIFGNGYFISTALLVIAMSAASYLLQRDYAGKRPLEQRISPWLLVYGIFSLLVGFENQILLSISPAIHGTALATLGVIALMIYTSAGVKLAWLQAKHAGMFFIVLLAVSANLLFSDIYGLTSGDLILLLTFVIASFWSLNVGAKPLFKDSQHHFDTNSTANRISLLGHIFVTCTLAFILFSLSLWLLVFGFTVFAIVCNTLGLRFKQPMLQWTSLSLFPVLVLSSWVAIDHFGDLINLAHYSDIIAFPLPLASGLVLWPLAFCSYFYLLNFNRRLGQYDTQWLLYGGALLIAGLCLYVSFALTLVILSAAALLCCWLSEKLVWPQLRRLCLALSPALAVVALAQLGQGTLDLFNLARDLSSASVMVGVVLWPLAIAVAFATLYRYDRIESSASDLVQNSALLLGCSFVAWQGNVHLLSYVNWLSGWHFSYNVLIALGTLVLIERRKLWPFSRHFAAYQDVTCSVLQCSLLLILFGALVSVGQATPLPWVVIANPMTLSVLAILMALIFYRDSFIDLLKLKVNNYWYLAILAYVFSYSNTEIMRAVHYYADVDWEFSTLLRSSITQTAFSIFWTIIGLVGTMLASKKQWRNLWLGCGALLAIVVLKLFILDMAAINTIERIISFIVVGLLLVVIGYFSPLPPKKPEQAADILATKLNPTTGSLDGE